MNSVLNLLTTGLGEYINMGFLFVISYLFIRISELYGGSIGIRRSIKKSDPELLLGIIAQDQNRIVKYEKLITYMQAGSTSTGFLLMIPEIAQRLGSQTNLSGNGDLAVIGLFTMIFPSLLGVLLLIYISVPAYKIEQAAILVERRKEGKSIRDITSLSPLAIAIGQLKKGLRLVRILSQEPVPESKA